MEAASTARIKTGSFNLLPLFILIMIDIMGIVLVLPVLTPLILQVDGSILLSTTPLLVRDFLYGFALALFPLFMFFSTPILGDLSDRFGRKNILLFCLLTTTVSYIISVFGIIDHNLGLFLISRAIAGLASGTQSIATAAIIDLSTPENKTKHLSWVVLASSIGIIIGPLLGGLTAERNLLSWFGYETPFAMAGIISLLNAILLFYSFQEIRPLRQHEEKIKISKGFSLFLAAFSQKKFRLLSCIYVFFALGWGLYFQTIAWFFMEKYHYSPAKLGLFSGFIGIIFALSTGIVSRVAFRFFSSETSIFLFFVMTMAIANIASAITQSESFQWFWVIFNACGNVICYTVALSLFSNLADKKSQGWIMGVTGALAAITWTAAGLFAGPLGYLSIHAPLWVAGTLCLSSFILMLIYRKSHYQQN